MHHDSQQSSYKVGQDNITFEGVVAAVLLLVVGGAEALGALQAMTVSTGLPFTAVLLAMCYSTWVGLQAASKQL